MLKIAAALAVGLSVGFGTAAMADRPAATAAAQPDSRIVRELRTMNATLSRIEDADRDQASAQASASATLLTRVNEQSAALDKIARSSIYTCRSTQQYVASVCGTP